MTLVDADFLRNVQEHCNGGLEWCEKHEIKWLDLIKYASMTASAAAEEDAGLASYGVAMFKLGYEVRHAQCEEERDEEAIERRWPNSPAARKSYGEVPADAKG